MRFARRFSRSGRWGGFQNFTRISTLAAARWDSAGEKVVRGQTGRRMEQEEGYNWRVFSKSLPPRTVFCLWQLPSNVSKYRNASLSVVYPTLYPSILWTWLSLSTKLHAFCLAIRIHAIRDKDPFRKTIPPGVTRFTTMRPADDCLQYASRTTAVLYYPMRLRLARTQSHGRGIRSGASSSLVDDCSPRFVDPRFGKFNGRAGFMKRAVRTEGEDWRRKRTGEREREEDRWESDELRVGNWRVIRIYCQFQAPLPTATYEAQFPLDTTNLPWSLYQLPPCSSPHRSVAVIFSLDDFIVGKPRRDIFLSLCLWPILFLLRCEFFERHCYSELEIPDGSAVSLIPWYFSERLG